MTTKFEKLSVFILRVSMGWVMFYAGITKVLDPEWSAAGYLQSAKSFAGLYRWFLQPNILPIINFINEWGLTLLGVSLILGVFVRLSSILGAILMLLYYFPILDFPYAGHGFIVDDHIIYALVLIFFAVIRAGRVWGLDKRFLSLSFWSKLPALRKWVG